MENKLDGQAVLNEPERIVPQERWMKISRVMPGNFALKKNHLTYTGLIFGTQDLITIKELLLQRFTHPLAASLPVTFVDQHS